MIASDPSSPLASASIVPVSKLNQAVARLLERSFPLTWISGEISNFTRAASGHWYFTLKDDAAQVRAVMFRSRAQLAGFMPREGDRVEVRALVTLYAPRGDFQLNVEAIRRSGAGNLYEAFLRLKEKLTAESLFDAARKRELPVFPRAIGIVTSPQAAALHDVLTALARRAPHVRVIVYPTPVQGDGAALKIAQTIATASRRAECDLLLLCRGGGSIEDLWAFNEEPVARALAACSMPVIAGVGHETDVTIADFAADLRAPTPTAAAELATRPRADWLMALETQASRLQRAMTRRMADAAQSVDWLSRRLISPSAYIGREQLQLQSLSTRLTHAARAPVTGSRHALLHLHTRLTAQLPDTDTPRAALAEQARRFGHAMSAGIGGQRQALTSLAAQLELLNPQRTLERGYAIVTGADGQIVRSPAQLHAGDAVGVQLAQGSAQLELARVKATMEAKN
ncbi:MAG: exodeoxyribonuclease large subunit [Burkholderiaceae bacterium]|nr:exodeoxyribonuclease large subunit [Burkholderiaceae bacterium]